MAKRCVMAALCLAVVLSSAVSLGCAGAFTEERVRRREYVIQKDMDRLIDDVDWLLGLEDPAITYDDSLPPGP